MMDGILVVDKPAGFTSFDVVAKLRGICQTRKIGHGGTLDPMATGVLPVFVGMAAKAVDLQERQDKTYEAEILFGIKTDTGDVTGEILQQMDVDITQQRVAQVLPCFLGEQNQIPPMYSAVKINGKALYKYARAGEEVERKPRPVVIHSIDPLELGAAAEQRKNRFSIRVHCSKGTYIRTLAEQIGEELGVPATLAALRRTQAGMFTLSQSHTLEQIQHARDTQTLTQLLCPVETVFENLPLLQLSPTAAQRLYHGAAVYGLQAEPGRYRVHSETDFLGLAQVDEDGMLHTEKLFVKRDG